MTEEATHTVEESRTRVTQLMRPQDGNFAGNVHGGVLLGLMDEAAYLCASDFAGAYCVTVSVDQVRFEDPVRVGERVEVEAAVHATGQSSMEVGITVRARDPQEDEEARRTNSSYFTMVALDEEGEPVPVPDLELESEEDHRRRCEAQLRRQLRQRYSRELEEGLCRLRESDDGAERERLIDRIGRPVAGRDS